MALSIRELGIHVSLAKYDGYDLKGDIMRLKPAIGWLYEVIEVDCVGVLLTSTSLIETLLHIPGVCGWNLYNLTIADDIVCNMDHKKMPLSDDDSWHEFVLNFAASTKTLPKQFVTFLSKIQDLYMHSFDICGPAALLSCLEPSKTFTATDMFDVSEIGNDILEGLELTKHDTAVVLYSIYFTKSDCITFSDVCRSDFDFFDDKFDAFLRFIETYWVYIWHINYHNYPEDIAECLLGGELAANDINHECAKFKISELMLNRLTLSYENLLIVLPDLWERRWEQITVYNIHQEYMPELARMIRQFGVSVTQIVIE